MFNRSEIPHVVIGGMPVARLTRAETAKLTIEEALERRGSGQSCLFFTTSNGQVISECASRDEVRRLYQQADLISPDGMSVVKASRLLYRQGLPERVATTDAFHDAAELAIERGATFYFLGASEEMSRAAVEGAQRLYPKLRIVGRRNGYFGEADEDAIVAAINEAQPDVLWVGMGIPRQQDFVVRNRARLTGVGVAKTCGGLFDFLSGKNSRAPQWMQSAGLEWLYRMSLEPRRLFLRYMLTNPHAMYLMLRHSGDDDKTQRAMATIGWR